MTSRDPGWRVFLDDVGTIVLVLAMALGITAVWWVIVGW